MAASGVRAHLLDATGAGLMRDVMLRCWTGTIPANSSAFRETTESIAVELASGAGAILFAGGEPIACGRFLPVPGPGDTGPDWVEIKRVGVVRDRRGEGLGRGYCEAA